MNSVIFKGYKVSKCDFVNNFENGQNVEFENKYSYSVKYSQQNICVGEITVDAQDKKNPENFHINIAVTGFFEFKPDVKKEVIHVESFKQLFPYARTFVSTVSTAAGIPPIFIPFFDIESQSIYKVEKNF